MLHKETHIPHKPLQFFLFASKPHAGFMLAAFAAVAITAVLSSVQPYFFGRIIDAATTAVNGSGDFSSTLFWVFVVIAVVFGAEFMARVSGFIGMQWVTRAAATAYTKLFEYLSLHSHSYFTNRFAGALTNKVSHAADGVDHFAVNFLWNYAPRFISFIVSGYLIFITDLNIGLIFVGLTVFLIFINYFFTKYRRPYIVAYAIEQSNLRGQAVDTTSNIVAMKQFARRSYELGLLGRQIEARRFANLKEWRLGELGLLMNGVIIASAMGVMFFMAFALLRDGAITLGVFTMIVTLMLNVIDSLTFIGNMLNGFIRIYGDIDEGLSEVLVPYELSDKEDATELAVKEGEVSFDDVTFKYPETHQPVFENLSFTITPGQKVGLVGESGAGKTTLMSLILRQHDINRGAIRIDNQNIAEVTQDSLRASVSVIPQDPLLFHRSIKDNIRYGKLDATDEEVERAAKMAQAHDFIVATPKGYETFVGERGIKLSGGQRQRIAIARAILKNAPILILDEATSSLDSESELLIQQALHELMKGKTVIAIAHRLSTLREMDRIIVFEKGKIAEDGMHSDLVEAGGTYARLWSHQAGGFLQDEE